MLGLVAFAYRLAAGSCRRGSRRSRPTRVPMIFRYITPPVIGLLGLAAIIGAVTSSFSLVHPVGGIDVQLEHLHAAAAARPVVPPLEARDARSRSPRIGVGAVWMALEVQSVQALWFFTSDLVFVLLFPQLVSALFDPKANLAGLGRGVQRVAGPARRRRRAAVRDSRADSVSGDAFRRKRSPPAGLVLLPLVSRLTAELECAASAQERRGFVSVSLFRSPSRR